MKASLLAEIETALRDRRPVGLVLPLDGHGAARVVQPDDSLLGDALQEAVRRDRPVTIETESGAVFVRPYAPRLRLLVVGAVHITAALVPMARAAGYSVVLIDPRAGFARAERWPGVSVHGEYPDEILPSLGLDARTAVVALTHDPKIDDPALEAALASDVFYIGALGSRRTHARRRERLSARGHDSAALDRIHGPVGLHIGAATPPEIAIAILAELTACLRQRPAGDR